MKVLLFCLLCAVGGYHVFFAKREEVTKPLLAPLAAVFYVVAAREPYWLPVLAFAFCCAGDVLLMKRGTHTFVIGGVCFLTAHMILSVFFLLRTDFAKGGGFAAIIGLFVFAAAVFAVMRCVKDTFRGGMFAGMAAYLGINGLMNTCALLLCFVRPECAAVFAGAVMFFLSDAVLFLKKAKKLRRIRGRHAVMFTYLLALVLLAIGMAVI